jgi:8-amino-7-oxononanoate synthase
MVASVRAAYKLVKQARTTQAHAKLQDLVKHLFRSLSSSVVWQRASENGVARIPLAEDWESRSFVAHIVPIWTRARYNYYLFFHLRLAKIVAFPIDHPVVPKGTSRVRLVFHANNTMEEVDKLVASLVDWAQEMLDIENSENGGALLPIAARQVYAWQNA